MKTLPDASNLDYSSLPKILGFIFVATVVGLITKFINRLGNGNAGRFFGAEQARQDASQTQSVNIPNAQGVAVSHEMTGVSPQILAAFATSASTLAAVVTQMDTLRVSLNRAHRHIDKVHDWIDDGATPPPPDRPLWSQD